MRTLFLASLLLLSLPVKAQDLPHLFFHEDEIEIIESEVQELPAAKRTQAKHSLHLDSILYIDAKHWTVWMQGHKITPENQPKNHRVFDVTPQSLRITAKLRNGHMITQTLAPYQSLNLLTGSVVEGGS